MTPATAAIPVGRSAAYEDWRPPVVGVALLMPIGADCLVVADLHGLLMLPVGDIRTGQSPQEAAERILTSRDGLPPLRRVVVDQVQMRRRKVITHVLAPTAMTCSVVEGLAYRDPRATLRVMPTVHFIGEVWPKIRLRVVVGLQALATGEPAFTEGGVVRAAVREEIGS
ncbi:hypothetical protein R6V09_25500 [Streptomyces sp. W16]|uniref:hypothetical protein n=1 Tax=Streptomyces sp. W16 TaxID=3076631 RepID=UPI00295BE815|nr:hypothetical protein [Streptomyces sp. W16]MDV9173444.1 hypothetical protein [Streptomyces sp. W16]